MSTLRYYVLEMNVSDNLGEIERLIARLVSDKNAMKANARHMGETSAMACMIGMAARAGNVESVYGLCCALFALGYQAKAGEPDEEIWG